MTDDKKTSETPLTVEAYGELVTRAANRAFEEGKHDAEFALRLLASEAADLRLSLPIKPRADTPSPRPEPKFEKEDWVQFSHAGRVGQVRCIRWRRGLCVYEYILRDVDGWWRETELLPVPPKPETVQPGYSLTGVVKVPDRSEPYVGYCGGELIATSAVYLRKDICGGLRWMVELDPRCCPHCHKELPA